MLDRNLKKKGGHDNFSKHFSIQKQIYLTVLGKEQHKKVRVTLKKTSCNHVFLRNMSKKEVLTTFLNLPVEEEVSIKAKYSEYYLNNVSKPSRDFKKKEGHSNAVNAKIPVHFLMTNNCLQLNQKIQETKM